MSGPKSSRYTLTAEQRRILEEQRLAEIRRIEEERKKNNLISVVTGINSEISGIVSRQKSVGKASKNIWNTNGDDGGWEKLFAEMLKEEKIASGICLRLSTGQSLESLEKEKQEVSTCKERVKHLDRNLSIINKDNESRFNRTVSQAVNEAFKSIARSENEKLDSTSKQKAETEKLREEYKLQVSALQELTLSKELYEDIEKNLKQIDSIEPELLKTFGVLNISQLKEKCSAYVNQQVLLSEEFDSVYIEYQTLCQCLDRTPENYTVSRVSISKLKDDTKKLQEEYSDLKEKEYIAAAIDDAMAEMGYAVLGHKDNKKKSGKHIKKSLYQFGDDTVINVSSTSDGQISMELGAIDYIDRTPTQTEAKNLCKEMQQFCGDFTEIEKILLRKGVVLADRIQLLPPEEQFAQVINIEGYDLKGSGSEKAAATNKKLKEKSVE